jgi:nitric oxide reductase large subunit
MKSSTAWCWLAVILVLLLGVLAYLGWKMHLSVHPTPPSVASQWA